MRVNLIKAFGIVLCMFLFVQTNAKESVNREDDSLKIILLNQQAAKYTATNADSAIYYGELALKLSIRSKQFYHLNETHKVLGWSYFEQHDYKKAQPHLQFSVSDTVLTIADRIKIYDALSISAENNHDYQTALLFSKKSQQIKDALNEQKHTMGLADLQRQLHVQQELQKAELRQQSTQLRLASENEDQLKQIFMASEVLLLLVIGLLCFLLYYNNKKFKKAIAEKNIELAHLNKQVDDYQSEFAGLHHLKNEIETEHREKRKEEIIVEEKQPVIVEPKTQTISLLDLYQNASDEERKKIVPKLNLFKQNVPGQLQLIEQAFSKHDWNKINDTLQSIKPFVQSLGMQKEESLINEINEHVNANATNRAVVKLLQVKSSCLKAIGVIENILK